jgi:hypothetical protein
VTEPVGDRAAADFDLLWRRAALIGGWLTRAQARRLWDAAAGLPPRSTVVEIGSHRGRSTAVLASAVRGAGGRVVAIDPFLAEGRFGGRRTADEFRANIEGLELSGVVQQVQELSQVVLVDWSAPIDLLYIDGKHDYWSCSRDLAWVRHCRPGTRIYVHDAFSSLGVTTSLLRHVLLAGLCRYEGRTGSLASFVRAPATAASRRAFVSELPWWGRNLLVKVALRTRAYPAARALGHTDTFDPY